MRLPFDLERPLVFFDLETTGLSISEDRIVELAIIKLSPQGAPLCAGIFLSDVRGSLHFSSVIR